MILSKMMWANEWLERHPICVEFGLVGLFFRSWFGHCHSLASRAAIVRQIFAVVQLIFMLRTSASTLGTSLAGRSSKCARPFSRNRFQMRTRVLEEIRAFSLAATICAQVQLLRVFCLECQSRFRRKASCGDLLSRNSTIFIFGKCVHATVMIWMCTTKPKTSSQALSRLLSSVHPR